MSENPNHDKLVKHAVYEVDHIRKGSFQMRVDSWDETWITGRVTYGRANAILDYNVKHEGDPITVRREFCKALRRAVGVEQ